jgi:hypothetical protein
MYQEEATKSPVAMATTFFTGLLSGLVGLVYVTLGGIALLSIFGFLYALLAG